ncbi:site-specific DNA-methyltransferase [Candidatus Woesearchaeota archaeon]|jgi:DNA modification methylase|nr:site-specific DNA-methyltransferase [Candidatus Woesearchaeota archaeon]|tara:strand:- start:2215 stop:3150 length:936 start_codon:yes stop_codon:yes gene_type:complete
MKTNHIYVGDNVETLKTLPDESVDMCITSPPYYNLRDYKNDDQLGSEPTVTDFVDGLIEVFNEIYRVMKPTGSCWVNIGDTYSDKKLLQVPSRFEIAMSDAGWSLRNEIIWNKPNPQPISSKDRFWSNHEKIFWFVKKTKGYYFDRNPIQVPQVEISVRRMFSNNNLSKRKDAGATEKEGFSLSSGSQDKHYARMRESLNIEKDFNYDELVASGNCPTRPMFSVWDISTTSYKGAHFAVYPPELIERPILSTCPLDGIVIDPFMGSGTTAVVARNNGRKYIGCELNPEYAALSEKRISESVVSNLKDFIEK